jgi:hypothetical protein
MHHLLPSWNLFWSWNSDVGTLKGKNVQSPGKLSDRGIVPKEVLFCLAEINLPTATSPSSGERTSGSLAPGQPMAAPAKAT